MALALLGLMGGLVALVVSLATNSRSGAPGLAQIDQTSYPALPTLTQPSYPGPAIGTGTSDAITTTQTSTPTLTGAQLTASYTPTLVGPLPFTPIPTIGDPAAGTPISAIITPVPSRTPLPSATLVSWMTSNWCVSWNTSSQVALVKDVLDGVTIEVEIDGKTVQVRYIGVTLQDAQGSPSYEQALLENRRLVEGKWVTLIKERSDLNLQGQWVRYVLAQGVFVNHELVRQGFVRAASFPPDISCDEFLLDAQELAQAAELGIWGPPAVATRTMVPSATPVPTSGDVRVVFINPKGEGWQDPEEFAEIRNLSNFAVQLSGWSLSDEKGHKFTFPNLVLISGGYCRIYTNQYVPETCGLSFYSLSAIWDDAGDCAYLRDPYGNIVSQLCY